MENFVFERSYPAKDPTPVSKPPKEAPDDGVYQLYSNAQRNYEILLDGCHRLVRASSGHIRAVIDYTAHKASIEFWCPAFTFRRDGFPPLLEKLSRHTEEIRITPLSGGELYVFILVPYFLCQPED